MGGNAPTLKVSHFSDEYKPGSNFAIVIMYSWKGEFTWFNAHKGFSGRFLYVAFQNTEKWPADSFAAAGCGQVHDYIFKDTFGEDYSLNKASCGGAGIKEGKLRFSSQWLNMKTSNDASYRHKWESDGSKFLNNAERALIKFATQMWMRDGVHKTYTIPSDLHNYLMGRTQENSSQKREFQLSRFHSCSKRLQFHRHSTFCSWCLVIPDASTLDQMKAAVS